MLWALFGVLDILRHYVARALGLVFLVMTVTIASIG